MEEPKQQSATVKSINTIFTFLDEVILVVVAIGIIALAVAMLVDALYEGIFLWSTHTLVHLISELMLVLILMELFRQVMRQFNRHSFSLSPFIYIGFIASIRGILLVQMGLSMGELEWKEGITRLSVHAVIVLILAAAYFVYVKARNISREKTP
jgi:uncharacterized membrane protein (DUF373 family)